MQGIVLSRTAFGSQFCFCVHDLSTSKQLRPILCNDRHSNKFGLKTQQSIYLYNNIWPGTILEYEPSSVPLIPRITHPEDFIVKPKLNITGTATTTNYKDIINMHSFESIEVFIPMLKIANMKTFIDSNESTQQSVGYIKATKIKIFKSVDFNKKSIKISITDKAGYTTISPLKDVWQLHYLFVNLDIHESIIYKNVVLRLSLSHPYNPDSQWDNQRCYLQVSRIELM